MILLGYSAAAQQVVGSFLFSSCVFGCNPGALKTGLRNSQSGRSLVVRQSMVHGIDFSEKLIFANQVSLVYMHRDQPASDFGLHFDRRLGAEVPGYRDGGDPLLRHYRRHSHDQFIGNRSGCGIAPVVPYRIAAIELAAGRQQENPQNEILR